MIIALKMIITEVKQLGYEYFDEVLYLHNPLTWSSDQAREYKAESPNVWRKSVWKEKDALVDVSCWDHPFI